MSAAFSRRNPWVTGAVGITALVAVASAVTGFVWLPSLQSDGRAGSLWTAICSAAGLISTAAPPGAPIPATYKTSDVVVTAQMFSHPDALSIGRGATLSLQCTMCHGARGLSEADSPNLAGQYAAVIFKQLHDYKSGARVNAIMSPRVADLSEDDIRDIAAYYAYLPRLPSAQPAVAAPVIVEDGSPMRNIAPCAACHGATGHKTGSAWLEGESPVYLKGQLQAFASGARHNDINGQMRNVARGMTPAEIESTAQYYAHAAVVP
jgi:cytochrome c553